MSLDSSIDALYQKPLSEFTAARNALARTLKGDEARRVKALAKPTVVPWAVNQLYWKARNVYERLMKTGDAMRQAQIAALTGGNADLRKASEAHRAALAEALTKATELAEAGGSSPDPDALSRTLESLSLAPDRPDSPGRLTEALRPAGFEALLGVAPAAGPRPALVPSRAPGPKASPPSGETVAERRARREAEREAEREAARAAAEARAREQERARARRAAVQAAERQLERARAVQARARKAAEEAERALKDADAAVRDAERALFAAKQS